MCVFFFSVLSSPTKSRLSVISCHPRQCEPIVYWSGYTCFCRRFWWLKRCIHAFLWYAKCPNIGHNVMNKHACIWTSDIIPFASHNYDTLNNPFVNDNHTFAKTSWIFSIQWRNNERDGVWIHWRLNCLLRCWRRSKITKLRVTGLCVMNSLVTGEFPAQRASNAENVSISLRLMFETKEGCCLRD